MKLSISVAALRAMLLFASKDEIRAVINSILLECDGENITLIATDGRILAGLRLTPMNHGAIACAVIEPPENSYFRVVIPCQPLAEFVEMTHRNNIEAVNDLDDWCDWEYHTQIIFNFGSAIEATACGRTARFEAWDESQVKYPKVREAVPTAPFRPLGDYPFSAYHLRKICKAGQMLTGIQQPAIVFRAHDNAQGCQDISAFIPFVPKFYAILKGMRFNGDGQLREIPQWMKPSA